MLFEEERDMEGGERNRCRSPLSGQGTPLSVREIHGRHCGEVGGNGDREGMWVERKGARTGRGCQEEGQERGTRKGIVIIKSELSEVKMRAG